MAYSSETWVMRKTEENDLWRAERTMVRMMRGVIIRGRNYSTELMSMVG